MVTPNKSDLYQSITSVWSYVTVLGFLALILIPLHYLLYPLYFLPKAHSHALGVELQYNFVEHFALHFILSLAAGCIIWFLIYLPFLILTRRLGDDTQVVTANGRKVQWGVTFIAIGFIVFFIYETSVRYAVGYHYCYDTTGSYTYTPETKTQTYLPAPQIFCGGKTVCAFRPGKNKELWMVNGEMCPNKKNYSSPDTDKDGNPAFLDHITN